MSAPTPQPEQQQGLKSKASIGNNVRRHIAAFDFDGTLTHRDTLIPFLANYVGAARFANAVARLGLSGIRGQTSFGDRDGMKERMISILLAGETESSLKLAGRAFADDILQRRLNPAVLERLQEHRRAGHEIVFVSASLVYYLDAIATDLGVDAVIAVEPTVVDGRLDGSLGRPNVRAEEKAIRLREWLEQTSGALDDAGVYRSDAVEVWAYGNSSGDHALLSMADHAFWLGRPSKRPEGVIQFDSDDLRL